MNYQELKHEINEDVETIKNLDPDIIPVQIYYLSFLKLAWSGFWKIWLIMSMTIAYAGIYNPSNKELASEPVFQIMGEAALMAFLMSLVAMLLLSPSINLFILFRFHLANHLKTGSLLITKFKHIALIFFTLFSILCIVFASYSESAAIFLMVGFAFFGSLAATYFLVKMELNRIGVTTIFTVIKEFFIRGKGINIMSSRGSKGFE